MPEAVITTCSNCRFYSGIKYITNDFGRPVMVVGTCRRVTPKEGEPYPIIYDSTDYFCNRYKPVEEVYDNAGNSN